MTDSTNALIGSFTLIVVLLAYLFKRLFRRPRRRSRWRGGEYEPDGVAIQGACACPAPISRGTFGLPVGPPSYFPMAASDLTQCSGIHHFSSEAVPASISPEERIDELTKFIKIFVSLTPLSRGGIKLFCGDPPSKGCVRSAMSGRRNVRVRFHPSTVEPTVTRRKARRHSPRELPSSAKDQW